MTRGAFVLCVAATAAAFTACAADGTLVLRASGTNLSVQVQGSDKDDWRLETAAGLEGWAGMPAFGTLLSGGADAPWRSAGDALAPRRMFRAVKTAGLYDDTLLRTINLTFTQGNWQTLLASGRLTGSNTVCSLAMDNGTFVPGAGARYKGNTSYTGMGGTPPVKKSINIEVDFTNEAWRVMGYKTLNLNNAYTDETIMREPLYFTVMNKYAVCPKGSFAKLFINNEYWGVYSFAQQENNQLVKEWCPSDNGDRWRAPNAAGGGGFSSGVSALMYLGTNVASYKTRYELKAQNSSNPWAHLVHATDVLNNTPTNELRERVEDVLAVDRWLWFLAIENIFADSDSYYHKGADYGFYYEPESGRIHPIEHDGNESLMPADVNLTPVQGATNTNRPVLYRLLGNSELRQRYLAHMRTVLDESFNPSVLIPIVDRFSALTYTAIEQDTRKGYTMTAYNTDLASLKTFIGNRHKFLTNHVELRPLAPTIAAVNPPVNPVAGETPVVTAHVITNGSSGLGSVWLYHRGASYGRFAWARMYDDGAHGDGAAGDGVFGASVSNYAAGTTVRYYVEARGSNPARAAAFSPPRAEEATYSYRVGMPVATNTDLVINELMADNETVIADPQGEYDDWIELRNITDHAVTLAGRWLSDDPDNPRKWQFPAETTIAPNGYLLVWADEAGSGVPGLHANFKISRSGEQIIFCDSDANANAQLDAVTFGPQYKDISYGRTSDSGDAWDFMIPTPGAPNY